MVGATRMWKAPQEPHTREQIMTTTHNAATSVAPLAGPDSPAPRGRRSVRRLLTCGILAGPVLLGVGLAQVFTRDGFDLERHALSQLALVTGINGCRP